jgi:hypothetical protein
MIRSLTNSPTVCIEKISSKQMQVMPNKISLQGKPAAVYSGRCSSPHTTPLPLDFKPASYTVIIGRGREPKENIGNRRLHVIAASFLPKYSNATDKQTKTRIVSNIVSMIRDAAPAGAAFVKRGKDGRWYEVNYDVPREKVGYIFRELLSDRYRSSSKSKAARRIQDGEERGREGSDEMEHTMRLTSSYMEKKACIPTKLYVLGNADMRSLDNFRRLDNFQLFNKLEDDDINSQDLLTAPLLLF